MRIKQKSKQNRTNKAKQNKQSKTKQNKTEQNQQQNKQTQKENENYTKQKRKKRWHLKVNLRINLQPAPSANVESGLSHHGTQDSAADHHTVDEWSANWRPNMILRKVCTWKHAYV